MKLFFRLTLAVAASFCALPASVFAQVPTSVDPAQVEDRFTPWNVEPGASPEAAPSAPVISPPSSAKLSTRRFTLKSVDIQGATVYQEADFAPVFRPLIGREVALPEVQQAANEITDKYRREGYILSQAIVLPQETKSGKVTVRVVEGYIANVVIQGDVRQNSWRDLVGSYANKIKQEKPLRVETLERYLLLIDDLPGATARGVVRPSPETYGAADLVITVTHKLVDGSLTVDNRGTRFIGPEQYTGTLAANSALGLYERSVLRAVTTSPTSELQFFDLQHEEQVGTEGTRILFTASHSHTEPNYTLKPLDIEGNSKSLAVRAQHPFIRSRTKNLTGRAVFDYRNTDTDVFGGAKFSNDRVRSLRLGGEYDFTDAWRGINLIDAQISRGLNVFNASESGPFRSRTTGKSDYTKLNFDLSRAQVLPWTGFSVLGSMSGQYAMDELLASEQFGVGGAGFGGAYDPSELTGDHGFAARAELRYGSLTELSFLESYQAFGYYDFGAIWNKGNATPDNHTLASTGLGVRANFLPWASGSAEVGFPLTKKVAAENDKDPRFFFSVTGRF